MNQAIKILTALGMIFAGIGQMLSQYNEIVSSQKEEQESSSPEKDGN